jgi:hypothetical protein
LVENIRRLPNVFRYQKVKLKRELQNPDYEHLWIEFHDVVFGDFKADKFELRIGASMIDPKGFSLLPKLEFPLIDGKTKPFASWFAESADDFGPKFELRFSLEKQIFDVKTFQKLDFADQKLLQVLSFVLPSAINKLIKSKVSIHRPWASWSTFISETANILLNLTRALQAEAGSTDKQVKQNSQDTQTAIEGNTPQTSRRELSKSDGLSELSENQAEVEGRAVVLAATPSSATTSGRRSSDVAAAGRRKTDLVETARTAIIDESSGKRFVEAPTKLAKRKSVSVLVAKSANGEAASTKSAPSKSALSKSVQKTPKAVAKGSPKLSSKKIDAKITSESPPKSGSKERVGAS